MFKTTVSINTVYVHYYYRILVPPTASGKTLAGRRWEPGRLERERRRMRVTVPSCTWTPCRVYRYTPVVSVWRVGGRVRETYDARRYRRRDYDTILRIITSCKSVRPDLATTSKTWWTTVIITVVTRSFRRPSSVRSRRRRFIARRGCVPPHGKHREQCGQRRQEASGHVVLADIQSGRPERFVCGARLAVLVSIYIIIFYRLLSQLFATLVINFYLTRSPT